MPTSTATDVKRFRRAASQRLEEAEVLLAQGYTTIAVYLAGYAVECSLKALLLANAPKSQHSEILTTFRGQKAHDFHWLHYRLRQERLNVPRDIVAAVGRLDTIWTTDLRYSSHKILEAKAKTVLQDSQFVLRWAQRSS